MTLTRLAVVNRGVPAVRLLRAAREYGAQRGRPLRTVILHAEEERGSLAVREADDAVSVGRGLVTVAGRPDAADLDRLVAALRTSEADAVWIGWGPLARMPEVAQLCADLDLTSLGPSTEALTALADADTVASLATASGIGAGDGLRSRRGVREVDVLVLADHAGTTWPVGMLDGTVQRRGGKVLTESPAGWLPEATAERLRASAVAIMSGVGFTGAGTVSFLVGPLDEPGDPEVAVAYASAGLPLGHPVVELCAPVDLATLQLRIAEGQRLPDALPYGRGHALAVRLLAEDVTAGFTPTPGRVALFRPPTGPGLRIDAGLAEGDEIAPDVDTTVAEVAAWGADREEARTRLRRALAELPIVLEGGISNKGVLLELLDRSDFRGDSVDIRWLDRLAGAGELDAERNADVALVVAAVDAYDLELGLELRRFLTSARRGRPATRATTGIDVELLHRGVPARLHVARTGPRAYAVRGGGRSVDVTVDRRDAFQSRVRIGDRSHRVVSAVHGADHLVEVDGVPHRISRDDHGVVTTPVPGVVVGIPVTPGQSVQAGDTVAVVENMKMESAVRTSVTGRVREILTAVNVQVDPGTPLLRLDPLRARPEADGAPVALPEAPVAEPGQPACQVALGVLEDLVLGYEVEPQRATAAAEDLARACATDGESTEVLHRELSLMSTYADIHWLFRGRRDPEDTDPRARSPRETLLTFLRATDAGTSGLPPRFVARLTRALAHYGVASTAGGPALDRALYWMERSHGGEAVQAGVVAGILRRWLEHPGRLDDDVAAQARVVLGRLISATAGTRPVVTDLAREVSFRLVDEPILEDARRRARVDAETALAALVDEPEGPERTRLMGELVDCPHPLAPILLQRMPSARPDERRQSLEVMTRRYHRGTTFHELRASTERGVEILAARITDSGEDVHVFAAAAPLGRLDDAVAALRAAASGTPAGSAVQVDVYAWADGDAADLDALSESSRAALAPLERAGLQHVVLAVRVTDATGGALRNLTFRPGEDGTLAEDRVARGMHPMMARRLHMWRMSEFDLTRLPSAEGIYLFRGVARENPKDERLFALGEVRFVTLVRDDHGRVTRIPQLEDTVFEAFEGMRRYQAPLPPEKRLLWNRVLLFVWPSVDLDRADLERVARGLAPASAGLGLEEVLVNVRRTDPTTGEVRRRVLHLGSPTGSGFVLTESDPPTVPLAPLDEYTRKVVQSRRRGAVYPYELVTLLVAPGAGGRSEVLGGAFTEYDLGGDGRLEPVDRPPGRNTAGLVVGVVSTVTARHPDGMRRVALLGDPTKALGSLAEPECRRIMAALDLAEELGIPLEWYAISAGARIAMDSGTENMDWIADVLRRIIEFTQRGHELNVVVTGINVGAQPYWNAEATMLMHTKGILVMTPSSAMVLTGKQALDYSGSVSAEDNFGIGGYERVMGPNGQAQYWAPNIPSAVGVLLAHYDHAYVVPGERFPRVDATSDPFERDVRPSPHTLPGSPLRTVGEVMSDEANPGRKLPFDIRSVMRAVADADHPPLERWPDMADADTVVVWDAHLGGRPVCMLGIEGHAMPRQGAIPADGPDQWTSGTLFPMSSKKTARAVNACSGNRPLVVLANLSGFDGSPESMRKVQLEYGAEIGRAVVNFVGPIVFCVVSRYHGGAFVVFSQKLNPNLEAIAVEGAHASVIGGTPAAAVVFAGEVKARTRKDPRVVALEQQAQEAEGAERARIRAELADLTAAVRAEKIGEVAAEFDSVHDVERARSVGSVNRIVPAARLRPVLIEAVERGVRRELDRLGLAT